MSMSLNNGTFAVPKGAIMLHKTFDKDGPGLVGLVLSYIIFACILAAAFYVFL